MSQLDELERLVKLHQAGSLTEEEFALGKTRLLAARPYTVGPWPVAAVACVLLLTIALVFTGRKQSQTATVGPVANAPIQMPTNSGQVTQPHPDQTLDQGSPSSKLQSVFRPETIGGFLPHLEALAGPPVQVLGDTRFYEIDGCKVDVTANGNTIAKVTLMEVSRKCSFDLSAFGETNLPAMDKLRFGDLERKIGRPLYFASCLKSCGNAVDPSVYAYYFGPHSRNFIEILAEAPLVTNESIQASMRWEEAMKGEGEEYVSENRFNCDQKYNRQAAIAFGRVSVTRLTVELQTVPTTKDCAQSATLGAG